MQYLGGKTRIAGGVLPLIERHRKPSGLYVEPFLGGASIFYRVPGPKLGADIHRYLISMWVAAKGGWIPPENVTADEYEAIKADPNAFPRRLAGFVGFACSFGGKWMDSYAKNKREDNFARAGSRGVVRKAAGMKDASLLWGSYDSFEIPPGSFVYCDPPYKGTTGYRGTPDFDYDKFETWLREVAKTSTVLISEYSMPDDFQMVAEFPAASSIGARRNTTLGAKVERLFML